MTITGASNVEQLQSFSKFRIYEICLICTFQTEQLLEAQTTGYVKNIVVEQKLGCMPFPLLVFMGTDFLHIFHDRCFRVM